MVQPAPVGLQELGMLPVAAEHGLHQLHFHSIDPLDHAQAQFGWSLQLHSIGPNRIRLELINKIQARQGAVQRPDLRPSFFHIRHYDANVFRLLRQSVQFHLFASLYSTPGS